MAGRFLHVKSIFLQTVHKYQNFLMTNEMHSSYNRFLFHSFLSVLHVSNESSRSSSAARHNILHYCRSADDERLDSFETCKADKKNCGIKIEYKNCASRWSLTNWNTMHGPHNVKIKIRLFLPFSLSLSLSLLFFLRLLRFLLSYRTAFFHFLATSDCLLIFISNQSLLCRQ